MTSSESGLSSLPVVASSGQASTDESVHPLVTHRGPGSVQSGHRRSSSVGSGVPQSTSSLSDFAKRMKAKGGPGSEGTVVTSSPGDVSSPPGQTQPLTDEPGQAEPTALPLQQNTMPHLVSTDQGEGHDVIVERPPRHRYVPAHPEWSSKVTQSVRL